MYKFVKLFSNLFRSLTTAKFWLLFNLINEENISWAQAEEVTERTFGILNTNVKFSSEMNEMFSILDE